MERRVDRDDDAILPAGGQEADHAREIGAVDDLGRGPREHLDDPLVICHGKSGALEFAQEISRVAQTVARSEICVIDFNETPYLF